MNVRELKELLEALPDETEIVLQKDAEGNVYSPLKYGDSYALEDACMDLEGWEKIKLNPYKVLILYPVN